MPGHNTLTESEDGSDIEVLELEILGCTGSKGAVEFHRLTEVVLNHLVVVGAGAEHSGEIVGHGIGIVDCTEGLFGLAVILVEDLGESGVVGLG